MAQVDVLRRYLEAGAELGQVTRSRAESIIKDLVRAGEVQREHTQERIDELVEWSRRNTDHLRQLVRREVNNQLSGMGIATKADLAALERKLKSGSATRPATKKVPAKKTAKKATKKAAKTAKKASSRG